MDEVYAQIAAGELRRAVRRDRRGGIRRRLMCTLGLEQLGAGGDRVSPPAVELLGITKRFGRVVACDRVDLDAAPWTDPRHPRRERRRQVDADEGADRARRCPTPARSGSTAKRCASTIRVEAAALGIGMVHQHFSLVEPLTVWENVALGDVGRFDPQRGAPARRRDQRAVRAATIDPDAAHRRPARRHAPAGRDHQVPAPRPAGARLRRADVGADAGGVGLPVRGAAPRRRGGGQGGRARQPQAARDPGGHGRDHDHARRPRRRHAGPRRAATRASLARAMVGREVSLRGERGRLRASSSATPTERRAPRPRRATWRADAAHHRRHGAQPGRPRCCSTGSRSRSPAARSSAWPASRATASASSATCCPACAALDAGTRRGRRSRRSRPGRAGAMAAAGVAVIPEDRHDSGCVLDFSVAENLFIADPSACRGAG